MAVDYIEINGVEARHVSPATLLEKIQGRDEIVILDLRDAISFAHAHVLYAVSLPLTQIELQIKSKVPSFNTLIVLTDDDGSLVPRAASLLARIGYRNLAVLQGGNQGWRQAGYEVFSGENVPSKAFGEVVEIQAATPHISAYELRERLAKGEDLIVVDGRTPEEFYNFSIPGAHSVPNAELAYRIRELAPDPKTLVVVNCAGRTRSIIGAQTLIDAGVPNPVVSLQDGTMAWLMAGFELDHGRRPSLPEPSAQNLAQARKNASQLLKRTGVEVIDEQKLDLLRNDSDRNTYLLDIRTREEYVAGHLPGWRWAAGGQVIQATDEYIPVLHSRVVIADWDGVRAATVAAWLVQLGQHEVYVYRPENVVQLETGIPARLVLRDPLSPASSWIDRDSLVRLQQENRAFVVDVDSVRVYAKQHITGASFAVAERIDPELLVQVSASRSLVLTSTDGILADAVVRSLKQKGIVAFALLGGNAGWFEAGLPTETGLSRSITPGAEHGLGAYDFSDKAIRHRKFKEYLDWEVGLVQQLSKPGAWTPYRVLGTALEPVVHGT